MALGGGDASAAAQAVAARAGPERQQQVLEPIALGCPTGQGCRFAPALPAPDIGLKLSASSSP
jgi:hypothetical protein